MLTTHKLPLYKGRTDDALFPLYLYSRVVSYDPFFLFYFLFFSKGFFLVPVIIINFFNLYLLFLIQVFFERFSYTFFV